MRDMVAPVLTPLHARVLCRAEQLLCPAEQDEGANEMTTIENTPDFDALRHRVRASQHARSVPLLVIGALLVNYSVVSFASQPVAWRYGAPLAFVLIWALGKVNETNTGVGPGRGDYLIAAAVVFIVTNLLLMPSTLHEGDRVHQLFGAWV